MNKTGCRRIGNGLGWLQVGLITEVIMKYGPNQYMTHFIDQVLNVNRTLNYQDSSRCVSVLGNNGPSQIGLGHVDKLESKHVELPKHDMVSIQVMSS